MTILKLTGAGLRLVAAHHHQGTVKTFGNMGDC